MQPARNINANYKTQHNTDKTFAKREEAFPFILHNVAIKMEKNNNIAHKNYKTSNICIYIWYSVLNESHV